MKTYDKVSIVIASTFLIISLFLKYIIGDQEYYASAQWIDLSFSLIFLGIIILRAVKEKELDKISLIMLVFIFIFFLVTSFL